ncbi:anaerobic ribonucleoside-triphosphate reductase [Fundicoccus sp. Sow4_H7]|uniref:anaerobic ribonucleoside-triphosphate reductase n=1 Tax=Fundicoccus sp. Sow4_H7 TaxID=3438784 RepID=UPI003F8F37AB
MSEQRVVNMNNIYQTTTDLKVKKRDGQIVSYRSYQIATVIENVFKSVKSHFSVQQIVNEIEALIFSQSTTIITSSSIYLIVMEVLRNNQLFEATELFEAVSKKQAQDKQAQYDVSQKLHELQSGDQTVVNENANKDSRVFNTTRDLTAGVSAKAIGLTMLPPAVANAHLKGDIHYHDLDYHPYSPMTNCCLIDFKGMLSQGFHIGNAQVESPRSINTATAQIAQIVANVASSQYGGCSADRIDEVLAPYARLNFEKHLKTAQEWIEDSSQHEAYAYRKTEKDIYDAMQSLEYEINTLYTSNGQTPFTTLGFGLGTDWFSRHIQKAILKVRLEGLGREKRTAIFPKLVFTLKDGVNLKTTDPNYDIKQMAVDCATKRMYPDVLMYDKIVELTGSFKAPMGCRSFLQGWLDENGNEVNSGRMNLGVVTLNIPRIAIEADGNQEQFWTILNERLEVAKTALLYRIERCREALTENAPILYQHGAFGKRLNLSDGVDEVFKNKRATISLGFIGLYEAASCFYGPDWEHNLEAKEFTLDILRHMKKHTDAWGNTYGYHFSVYSTPSESLTDRFSRLDKEKFGVIADITDKDYYTNSFHYDVRKDPNPFEKLNFEKDYAKYTSGGFIHYCEYPNLRQNPAALEAVWDFAYDKIGYLGTNTPIDQCFECQFKGDFDPTARGFRCPQCGNSNPDTCDVVKRTCGYLGNPQIRPMVKGRHKEISARVKHLTADQVLAEDATRAMNKETRMRILSHLDKY